MGNAMKLPFGDGTYAVPDPDRPDVMTMWWAAGGRFRAWPLGHRWAPRWPTPPPHLAGRERSQWRQAWYDTTYFPWRDRVLTAIAIDPAGAAAAFDRLVPSGERPRPEDLPARRRTTPRRRVAVSRRPRPRDRQARQALVAAALAEAGCTVTLVARALDLSRTTAWRRIQDGKERLAALHRAERAFETMRVARMP